MNFSEKLILLRKERNLSQEKLAEVMNVSRQAVSKWESGQSLPDIDKLIDLSNYFNVTLDSLMKDENPVSEKEPAEATRTEQKPSILDNRYKRMILAGLSGGCISICLYSLARIDQIQSKYQAIITVVYCAVGIVASFFCLLKVRKYKYRNM